MKRELGPMVIGVDSRGEMAIDKGNGVFCSIPCVGPLRESYKVVRCHSSCPHVKLASVTQTDGKKVQEFTGCSFKYVTSELIDYENLDDIKKFEEEQKANADKEKASKKKKRSWLSMLFCDEDRGPGSPIRP